jgi:predicted metal-dependent phosphoesterase TrpH
MTGPPKRVAALLDLHVHSRHSSDGRGTVLDLAARARQQGLQGFIVSDHNTYAAAKEIRASKIRDLLVVPGTEVTTDVGHCLAIGIRKAVPSHLSLPETLEAVEAAGGVGVPSHPYRFFNGVGERALDAAGKRLVAIEVYNARDGDGWRVQRADAYARRRGLGGTGGSDTHQVFEVGNAYTMFPDFPESVDDVVDMVARRRTWGAGRGTPKSRMLLQNVKNAYLWARRGFRPM